MAVSTYLHFGWGVPPQPSNSDSISDPKRHFPLSIVSQGEEYLPVDTLGGGVLPKPSNPDHISDPKRHFLHSIVSQGEEHLPTLWVGVCCPSLQILTIFQTPKDISYTLLLARGRSTYLHFGWGCAAQAFKSWPYFRPQKTFPTLVAPSFSFANSLILADMSAECECYKNWKHFPARINCKNPKMAIKKSGLVT